MRVTAAFYLSIFAALGGLAVLVHRGRVVLAAWAVSIFFWLVIAVVTLFFGGMQGQNASTFAVSVLLIGVVVGGRAAVWTAFVSSAWCGVVAVRQGQQYELECKHQRVAEHNEHRPAQSPGRVPGARGQHGPKRC